MMKMHSPRKWGLFAAGAVLAAVPAYGQQVRRMAAKTAVSHTTYDAAHEVSVQGTVVEFTENSTTPPIGAHVLIQTSAGNTIDVLLGDARLLKQNNLSIATGSNIRVVGGTMKLGQSTAFVARLVQQGTQVVAMRSTNGMLYVFAGNRGKVSAQSGVQGGPR